MGASFADTELDDETDFAETHEINVTPFIDVILVLLIIFMVAAPLSTVDLPIDLPSSTATPQKKPDNPTYVSIKPDLAVAIGENQVKRVDLVRTLDAMADASKDRFIFLRADRSVPYGEMMDVLEILRAGGYSKIKLVALESAGDRDRTGTDIAARRSHRSATRSGHRGLDRVAGGCRAKGRTQRDGPAEGRSDRGRKCGSGGDTERLPQATKGRRENRRRRDLGFNRIRGGRGNRNAKFRSYSARHALGRAGAGNGSKRAARADQLAEGTDRSPGQA